MTLAGWIHDEIDKLPAGEPRKQRMAELMTEVREEIASDQPVTAAELTAPIIEALEATLVDLRDRAENHRELVLYHEFNGLTVDEVRAARAELALHHAFADRLAACFRGLVPAFEHDPAPALRQALYTVLGTEDLAYALSYNSDNFPDDD